MKKLLDGIDQVRQHIEALANERPDDCTLRDASELIQVVHRAVKGTDLLKAFGAPGDWGYDTLIGDGLFDALKTRKPGDVLAIDSSTAAAGDVLGERKRQIEKEGFDTEHDDEHQDGDLAAAAACYALEAELKLKNVAQTKGHDQIPTEWPWSPAWWKPKTPRRDLVRAAALIIAEIEKIDRAAEGKAG